MLKNRNKYFIEQFLIFIKREHINFFHLFLLALIILGFALSASYAISGDLFWNSDISRDFLILEEINQKKIILIGPRSYAAPGLFHSPIWAYLNFPAFFLSGGNPVAVGAFWVILNALFLVSSFFVARKLTNTTAAYIFTLLLSVKMIGFVKDFFNPYGAMMLIPLFIYFLIQYLNTQKIIYLVLHVLVAGLVIQFQIAVGVPLILLSATYVLVKKIKEKKNLNHLIVYLLTAINFVHYILFDVRHNLLMSKAIVNYLNSKSPEGAQSFTATIQDRIIVMFSKAPNFFPQPNELINYFFFGLILISLITIKINKNKYSLFILLYFYFGFFFLSIVQRSDLPREYYFPLVPIIFLVFVSLTNVISRRIIYILALIIFIFSLQYELNTISTFIENIGTSRTSWQFHNKIAKNIFENSQANEFGVFIYSPEHLAYRGKYPLVYQQNFYPNKKMNINKKLTETYVVVVGPPETVIPWEFNPDWFVKEQLKIEKPPVQKWDYNEQYSIWKFQLSKEEIQLPPNQDVINWLTLR